MKNPICVAYRYTTKSIIFFLVSSFLGQGESLVILEEKKLDGKVLPVSCSTRQKCAVTAMTLVFFISSFLLFFFFFFFFFSPFFSPQQKRKASSFKKVSITYTFKHALFATEVRGKTSNLEKYETKKKYHNISILAMLPLSSRVHSTVGVPPPPPRKAGGGCVCARAIRPPCRGKPHYSLQVMSTAVQCPSRANATLTALYRHTALYGDTALHGGKPPYSFSVYEGIPPGRADAS